MYLKKEKNLVDLLIHAPEMISLRSRVNIFIWLLTLLTHHISPLFQACPPMRKMRAVPAVSVRVGRAVLAVLGELDASHPSPDLLTPPRPAAQRGGPSGPHTPCLPSVWTFLMATVSVSLLVEIFLCADDAYRLVSIFTYVRHFSICF